MNSNKPYDEYVEETKVNHGDGRGKYKRKKRRLTECLSFWTTPQLKKRIDDLVEMGLFPDRAEFLRYIIVRYFENNKTKKS